MDESESTVQSFVLRVWVEERAGSTGQGVWRGHITHVPGDNRRYLKSLDEIGDYLAPYLVAMGVKPGMRWRRRRWLRRLTGRD